MNLLILCNKVPYPPDDGSSIAVYSMLEGLTEAGANVHVLAINTYRHFKPDSGIPEMLRNKWNYKSVYKNTNPSLWGALWNLMFSALPYFGSRFFFKKYRIELEKILQKHPFEVVQLEGLFMGMYIPVIRCFSRAKISYRAHNVEYRIWERFVKNEKNFLKKKYLQIQIQRLKKFEKEIISSVDCIIPITEADAVHIKHWLRNAAWSRKCLTIPTGLVPEDYKYKHSDSHPIHLFFFGAMEWLPNVEAVRWFRDKVFPLLKKEIPYVRWTIAGRNMPEDIKVLQDTQIIIRENVLHKEEIFHTANVMVVPLLSGSGLKIKILEGMAYGKCVITTSVGAEGIEAEHEKEFYIADTPEAFLKCIRKINDNPELISKVGLNARELVFNRYNRSALGKKLFDYYCELIS